MAQALGHRRDDNELGSGDEEEAPDVDDARTLEATADIGLEVCFYI